MAIKKTFDIGSKVIRLKSKKVTDVSSTRIKKIIKDMIDTMREKNLVGISAPQIGVSERIFITEVRTTTYRKNISKVDDVRIFINPQIISHSEKQIEGYEGCGSVAAAGIFGAVKRYQKIKIKALNEKGEIFEIEAVGFLARIIQHEMDHLDGIVFIDRVTNTKSPLGREEYIKRGKKK